MTDDDAALDAIAYALDAAIQGDRREAEQTPPRPHPGRTKETSPMTDTTALQERIAQALFDHEHRHMRPAWRESAWTNKKVRGERPHYLARTAAVLPIIAAEVQAAKIEAWDEGQASGWRSAQEESQMNGVVGDLYHPHTETEPCPYAPEETP